MNPPVALSPTTGRKVKPMCGRGGQPIVCTASFKAITAVLEASTLSRLIHVLLIHAQFIADATERTAPMVLRLFPLSEPSRRQPWGARSSSFKGASRSRSFAGGDFLVAHFNGLYQ